MNAIALIIALVVMASLPLAVAPDITSPPGAVQFECRPGDHTVLDAANDSLQLPTTRSVVPEELNTPRARRHPARRSVAIPDDVPVAFVGVNVVPMTSNRVDPDQTVLIRDGRIEAIGSREEIAVPDDATVIDGAGRYLMPGLADLHTHLGIDLGDGLNEGPNQAEAYMAFGVTTVLNMGETLLPRGAGLMELRDRIASGELAGPTILTASIAYGPDDGVAAHQTVTSYADGRRHVIESRQAGYDMIKVYSGTPHAAFDGIADQARDEGMAVVGHIPRQLGLGESLSHGLEAVAHANQFWCGYFDCSVKPSRIQSAISLLRANDTTVQSTMYLNETFTDVYCGDVAAINRFFAQPEMRYVHPVVLDHWRRQAFSWTATGCHKNDAEPGFRFIQDYSRAFYDAGVPFVLGTDSPPVMGVPGFSLHEELRVVAASLRINPYEALVLATRNADGFVARTIPDAERFGAVESGRRADLLLLDANPLASLTNVRRLAGVMVRGRWFPESDLQARLARIASEYGSEALPDGSKIVDGRQREGIDRIGDVDSQVQLEWLKNQTDA